MAIERYGGIELSIERALRKAPHEFAEAYEWFLAHENIVAPRPWGNYAPEGISIKLCAQSGIQKPANYKYAISVTSSNKTVYAEDNLLHLDDGTWLFVYCAHTLNSGKRSSKVE